MIWHKGQFERTMLMMMQRNSDYKIWQIKKNKPNLPTYNKNYLFQKKDS